MNDKPKLTRLIEDLINQHYPHRITLLRGLTLAYNPTPTPASPNRRRINIGRPAVEPGEQEVKIVKRCLIEALEANEQRAANLTISELKAHGQYFYYTIEYDVIIQKALL